MHKTYSDFSTDRADHRETNDCTVIAVSVACGISYAKAHALLAAAGRKPRKGLSQYKYHPVIEALGFEVVKITDQFKSKTVRTIERELAAKYGGIKILVNVPRHVLAWDGTQIVDWSAGRIHRVENVYAIMPSTDRSWDFPWQIRGKTVPVPERRALNRSADHNVRHGCAVYIDDNLIGTYTSVAAAYKANGWNLRGHQKVRRIMKLYDEAQACLNTEQSWATWVTFKKQ
jgi:hypothetical protein